MNNQVKKMDTFPYATAATLCCEPVDADRIEHGSPQPVREQPTCCINDAGVLKYNRESDHNSLNITIPPESPPVKAHPVKCEYCGEEARPTLDVTWLQDPGTALLFCCAQRQQLCEMLVDQRCILEGRHPLKTGAPTSLENKPELNDMLKRNRGREDMFILDLTNELRTLPDPRILDPVAETAPPLSVFKFRLSCPPQKGCWIVCPSKTTEKCLQTEDEDTEEFIPFCDYTTLCLFGLCHHQDAAGFLQKYYSSGIKFLTVFPDGSAQVLCYHPYYGHSYPSGLLAVIVVTEENRRVCIVYDDSNASSHPIRAVFQSDGRATCYHNNGNIWLSLNRSGGQCLNELGARVRRWCWSHLSLTPLHPVFLPLNKTVGIRVLGKEQVFVSFLARGQQAKFSVGTSIQGEPKIDDPVSRKSILKEEVFVLAARIRINRAIQHLRWYLKTPFLLKEPKTKQDPQQNT